MTAILVEAGRETTLAVRRAVDEFQSDDPLQPVRVVVTSNVAGLSLRRRLGSRDLSGDDEPRANGVGIANVAFTTPFQLASELASPSLAADGARPLTTPVLAAAVRHVLATGPGRFGAVAEHVATETSLVRAFAEITELTPPQREALRRSSSQRTQDLLRFVDAVDHHLRTGTATTFHDEYAVVSRASEVAPAGLVGQRVVLVGPYTQSGATVDFLRTVAGAADVVLIASMTGDAVVDQAAVVQTQRILDAAVERVDVAVPQPSDMIAVCDPDQEAQVVVRKILKSAERGVRFDRMAVFVPVREPYLRSIREHLDRAGIPSAGPDHRTLADSMTGRLLRSVLDIADAAGTLPEAQQYERTTILSLVAAAPLRGPDGRSVQPGAWEDISRAAGVVGGLDDWRQRLDVYVRSIADRRQRQAAEGASPGYLAARDRERQVAEDLGRFVEWIGELTAPKTVGSSWADRSRWAQQTLKALLPPINRRHDWPETEINAAERIENLLARLSILDEVEPTLTPAAFRRAIQLELDAPAGRRGAFGTGVFVAPLASAVGIDLDEVFVVGLAEGVCPQPIREDTLLPDTERALAGDGLAQRSDRNREVRQRYLHAIAGGSRVTVTTPLGDHRTGRARTVSRWWVDAIRARTSEPTVTSRNWIDYHEAAQNGHGSFQQSLTTAMRAGMAASFADLQLQYVHARQVGECTFDNDELAGPIRRGLELTDQRLSGYNRFTGNLRAIAIDSPLDDDAAISPSRLESWAKCPRRFFFEQMLGLGEIERPEEILEISALDRGSLVHAILEDFVRQSLRGSDHAPDNPDTRWTEQDRQRLHHIADKRFREYEDLGRTGRPLLWRIQKEATRSDLDEFITKDSDLRAQLRTIPHDVELPFGLGGRAERQEVADAAQLVVNQRTIRLRGLVDRVDWRKVDDSPVVIDYKTGKAIRQTDFDRDPVRGGQNLQLGVYAEAAIQHYGASNAQAYYWYISTKGGFKRAGYPWTSDRRERFIDAVETIVDGIEGGDYPPNPGAYSSFYADFENCAYCPFTRICPVDRDEELKRAVESGELVRFFALREFDAEATEQNQTSEGVST